MTPSLWPLAAHNMSGEERERRRTTPSTEVQKEEMLVGL